MALFGHKIQSNPIEQRIFCVNLCTRARAIWFFIFAIRWMAVVASPENLWLLMPTQRYIAFGPYLFKMDYLIQCDVPFI